MSIRHFTHSYQGGNVVPWCSLLHRSLLKLWIQNVVSFYNRNMTSLQNRSVTIYITDFLTNQISLSLVSKVCTPFRLESLFFIFSSSVFRIVQTWCLAIDYHGIHFLCLAHHSCLLLLSLWQQHLYAWSICTSLCKNTHRPGLSQ